MTVDWRMLEGQVRDAANALVTDHAAFADADAITKIAEGLVVAGNGIEGVDFHERLVRELRTRASLVRLSQGRF